MINLLNRLNRALKSLVERATGDPKFEARDMPRILIGFVVLFGAVWASQATSANVDFSKLGDMGPIFGMPNIVSIQIWGWLLGALYGIPRGIQYVTLGYLGLQYAPPVINLTTRTAGKAWGDFRRLSENKADKDDKDRTETK